MTVTVRYARAPRGTEAPDSIFSRLVEVVTGEAITIVRDRKVQVDLELASVHAPELARAVSNLAVVVPGRNYRRRLRQQERWSAVVQQPGGHSRRAVWFTGENARPPGGSWDGYLSFDLDPLGGRNVYFPHWWEYLGLWSSRRMSYSGIDLTVEGLCSPRVAKPKREAFACAFIGNPTPMRLHAIEALSKLGRVDVFGNSVGKPVASKVAIARNYRFVLCFENDLYPGYVTEKPFEAWATGSIPLWWGQDPAGYINEQALVNAANFGSLSEFADHVGEINSDSGVWEQIASEPILRREPDTTPAIALLTRLLNDAPSEDHH